MSRDIVTKVRGKEVSFRQKISQNNAHFNSQEIPNNAQ